MSGEITLTVTLVGVLRCIGLSVDEANDLRDALDEALDEACDICEGTGVWPDVEPCEKCDGPGESDLARDLI